MNINNTSSIALDDTFENKLNYTSDPVRPKS